MPHSFDEDSVPADALPPGTMLHEYRVERVLGVGGFGIVYLCRDELLGRQVAIKEYLPGQFAQRGSSGLVASRTRTGAGTFSLGLRSFVNEARLLARFDHPTLVKVLRFWEGNGTAYMVMPFYQGITLREHREALDKPPSEAWIRALVTPILGALEMLHAESVFHRDVSPDNILILGNGQPLLLDFGAARQVIADRTQRLTSFVQPDFAPVEQFGQIEHLAQGAWTDLYALAAVVYFCMLGEPPASSINRVIRDVMQPFSGIAEQLRVMHGVTYSPAFLAAWQHAIAVMPEQRTQSVAQLRDELLAGDKGRKPAPPPKPPPAPQPPPATALFPPPARKSAQGSAIKRWQWISATALAMVLLGAFAMVVNSHRTAVAPTDKGIPSAPAAASQPLPAPSESTTPTAAPPTTPDSAPEPPPPPPVVQTRAWDRITERHATETRPRTPPAEPPKPSAPIGNNEGSAPMPVQPLPAAPLDPEPVCHSKYNPLFWQRCKLDLCKHAEYHDHPNCRELRACQDEHGQPIYPCNPSVN